MPGTGILKKPGFFRQSKSDTDFFTLEMKKKIFEQQISDTRICGRVNEAFLIVSPSALLRLVIWCLIKGFYCEKL